MNRKYGTISYQGNGYRIDVDYELETRNVESDKEHKVRVIYKCFPRIAGEVTDAQRELVNNTKGEYFSPHELLKAIREAK